MVEPLARTTAPHVIFEAPISDPRLVGRHLTRGAHLDEGPPPMPAAPDTGSNLDAALARMGLPLLVLVALGVSLRPGLQSDTYWHMASGRWMVEESAWLRVDVFSWTVFGRPWQRPGLPADIIMYGLHAVGGPPLLVVATAALFLGAFLVLFIAVPAAPRIKVGLGVITILASIVSASVRPLVVGLPLTALTAVILERASRGVRDRWLWALPVVAVVWVNTHGSFVVLFLLLGCHGLASIVGLRLRAAHEAHATLRRLAFVTALAVLGILVNPFGFRMLLYPFDFASVRVHHQSLDEWRQPAVTDLRAWPLFILLVISLYTLIGRRRRVQPQDIIVVVGFGALALTAIRHSSIFAIAVYPHLARILSPGPIESVTSAWGSANPTERRLEVATLGLLLLLTIVLTGPALTRAGNDRATAELMPTGAADAVVDAPHAQRVWNSFDVGGYVIWQGTPMVLVSMDSRADLYGDELVREHIAVWNGERPAHHQLIAQGVDTVLVERYAPLVGQLEGMGWTRVVDDGLGVVLRAPDPEASRASR